MRTEFYIILAVLMFSSIVGSAAGATITFDKSLDVPDRSFTATYEGSTVSFTVADIGNYKIGDAVGVTVSGGVSNMRLVLFTVDKFTPWFPSFYATSGSISTTIPANIFDSSCPDFCDGPGFYIVGPGIFALAVRNRDDSKYFIAKPVIVSDYDIIVTPDSTQASAGSTIKVTVQVSKNGNPVSVGSNNVKVTLFQDSTNTHFEETAVATATTGTYERNIPIPTSASGTYKLFAAITTTRFIYQDYPETIGAASYSGTITINAPTSTPTATPTAAPTAKPTPAPTAAPTPAPKPTPVSIISVGTFTVAPGSNVTVPVVVGNATLVAGGSLKITFNNTIATVQSVSAGDFGLPFANINNTAGSVTISTAGSVAVGKENATIVNITFSASTSIPSGSSTSLHLDNVKLTKESGSIITPLTSDGLLTVTGVKGDVNRNGFLDTEDATIILRNIVDLPIPSEYRPILPIGDMNCNGKLDTGDATLILRDIVGLNIPRC